MTVLGAGTAFPPTVLTTEELLALAAPRLWPDRPAPDAERLSFLASGLAETLGVRRRAFSHMPGAPLDHGREPSSFTLGLEAARRALADAELDPGSIDLVLASTSTPHRMTGTLSAGLGAELGIHAACMDVRAGCSGGLFALATAGLYLAAGARHVLLVGAETFSKILPPDSKIALVSLGDGAGALVLGKRPHACLRAVYLATDGALGRLITTDGALPPTAAEIERGGYLLSGAPEELLAVVPSRYAEAIGAALARAGITASEVDLFVPHQTSEALVRRVAGGAGIAMDRAFLNVAEHANIGAAGWICAFAEARASGLARAGARVLLAAVGGGMSWAAAVLEP